MLLQNITTDVRYRPCGKYLDTMKELYSIFHLADNLASSLDNGILNEKKVYHVSNIRTQIEAIQISPEDGFVCSMESYDICLARERQLSNSSCNLPFENMISYQNKTCSTFEQGMNTVRKILAIRENVSRCVCKLI